MTTRTLRVGPWAVAFHEVPEALGARLDDRWGPFVTPAVSAPSLDVRLGEAAPGATLGPWKPGETYRMEAVPGPGVPAVRSYGFVLAPTAPRAFALDLVVGTEEPAERRVENAARLLVARLALEAGGFALHGAAVLDGGRALVLAGPSRAGKTTAVAALGWPSLGDDFAVVVPWKGVWAAAATPFDNRERIPAGAFTGTAALAAIWGLEQGAQGGRRLLGARGGASTLLTCAAFPWALPDLTDALVTATVRCAGQVECGILTFALDTDLRALVRG